MDDFKTIPLTKGYEAIVDVEDFDLLSNYNWGILTPYKGQYTTYAMKKSQAERKGKSRLMHRIVMNAPRNISVDHINGNGLDNRKSNLRLCSHRENLCNSNKQRNGITSIYKGVSWDKSRNKWTVHINKRNLGRYNSEIEAALVYNDAALKYHGNFAKLNEIQDDKRPRKPVRI